MLVPLCPESLEKYAVKEVIKRLCKLDPVVRKLFKYLKFLPFVPPTDIVKAFKQIKSFGFFSNCKKFEPMFTYFETFYIGKLIKNSETVRNIPPYPVKRCNVVVG